MEAIAIKPSENSLSAGHREDFMAAMSRILSSRTFSKSARLSAFLRHVCMTTAEGNEKVLCEQHIGIAVFGRPDHYIPADDTIVRSSARLLRQRLATYYEEEGQAERFRITIPRGSYVPVFAPAAPVSSAPAAATVTALPAKSVVADVAPEVLPVAAAPVAPEVIAPAPPARSQWRWRLAWPALLVMAMVGWIVWRMLAPVGSIDASTQFWDSMLSADRETTLIVADNGLVMYQSEVHRQVALSNYTANYPGDADTAAGAQSKTHYGARRYTAMSSVTLAAEVGKRARAAPQRFHVRFARDAQLADLKHGNSILVGVEHSNPWWELYRRQFNFHINWDPQSGDYSIVNDHPRSGEQALYAFSGRDPGRRGYALIGLKRNLSGDGYTLLLGGTTSAGTDAAIEFLMNPASMAPLMQQAMRPNGAIAEFEVLLQCVLQANGSTDIQLLGLRVNPS